MWTDLVRRAEPEFAATPAVLLALSALRAGNGVLAAMAVQRALQADPVDSLAQTLADVVAAGIDPATVAALLAD
jgi:Tfp pilus assembly protein PilF